jgi:DNA-binding beta-propeller fold protein YncE
MNRGRTLLIGSTFAALLVALGVGQQALEKRVALEAQSVQAPRFEVDPMWPKPLPNGWYQGMTIGVWVDEKDHVWVVHRPDTVNPIEAAADGDSPTGACCKKAPPILEFDPAGNLVGHWGGPGEGYEWPDSNHGIFVDHKGLVWIGGNGGPDAHILKFTRDGKFVKQFGKKGQGKGSHDTQNFGRVAKIFVDAKANEAYIADGYLNKRVAVIDAETGEFKRFWGAYGNKPDDTDIGRFRALRRPLG